MKVKCLVALLILALSTTVALADSKKSVKEANRVETQQVKADPSVERQKQIDLVSKLIASPKVLGRCSFTYSFYAEPKSGDAEYQNQFSCGDGFTTDKSIFNLKDLEVTSNSMLIPYFSTRDNTQDYGYKGTANILIKCHYQRLDCSVATRTSTIENLRRNNTIEHEVFFEVDDNKKAKIEFAEQMAKLINMFAKQ